MPFNVGDLRHYVTILRPVQLAPDDYGRTRIQYVELRKAWAGIRDVSGREFFAASAVQMEDVVTITMRYAGDLRNDMRIKYGETVYNILQLNHLGYKRDYMQIKARVVQPEASEVTAHGYD